MYFTVTKIGGRNMTLSSVQKIFRHPKKRGRVRLCTRLTNSVAIVRRWVLSPKNHRQEYQEHCYHHFGGFTKFCGVRTAKTVPYPETRGWTGSNLHLSHWAGLSHKPLVYRPRKVKTLGDTIEALAIVQNFYGSICEPYSIGPTTCHIRGLSGLGPKPLQTFQARPLPWRL